MLGRPGESTSGILNISIWGERTIPGSFLDPQVDKKFYQCLFQEPADFSSENECRMTEGTHLFPSERSRPDGNCNLGVSILLAWLHSLLRTNPGA